jgi:hypothetical protein
MPIFFYSLGWLLMGSGGAWALFAVLNDLRLGQYAGIIAILVAAFYLVLAGALFVAIGAITHRLDRLIANTRPRVPVTPFPRDESRPRDNDRW